MKQYNLKGRHLAMKLSYPMTAKVKSIEASDCVIKYILKYTIRDPKNYALGLPLPFVIVDLKIL